MKNMRNAKHTAYLTSFGMTGWPEKWGVREVSSGIASFPRSLLKSQPDNAMNFVPMFHGNSRDPPIATYVTMLVT